MRGDAGTVLCPGCQEQHRPIYRLHGLPVLACPSIAEPGDMKMRRVPASVHHDAFVILLGTETEMVECAGGHTFEKHKLAEPDCPTCKAAREQAQREAVAAKSDPAQDSDTTTRRRRTA